VSNRLPEVIWTDEEQSWREKLALNITARFICVRAVFVVAVLGNFIYPTWHVFGGRLTYMGQVAVAISFNGFS